MRRVTFAARYPPERAHPIHRRIGEETSVTRMELLTWGPTDAVASLVWYDAGQSVVASLLEAVDVIETTHLVERDGGTYAFTTQEAFALDATVMELIERAAVAFPPPITFVDDGTARFDAVGEQAALSSFYDDLSAELRISIERVSAFSRRPGSVGVTERQWQALEVAVSVGYYEVPRTGSIADVAAEVDCAASTAGELLRKAERRILVTAVESVGTR